MKICDSCMHLQDCIYKEKLNECKQDIPIPFYARIRCCFYCNISKLSWMTARELEFRKQSMIPYEQKKNKPV